MQISTSTITIMKNGSDSVIYVHLHIFNQTAFAKLITYYYIEFYILYPTI